MSGAAIKIEERVPNTTPMAMTSAKPNSIPKGATREIYQSSTALEALFGYLYLLGRYERLNEIYEIAINTEDSNT